MEPIPIRTKVDGSGTAVNVLPEGPPGIAWIVNVAPLSMVRVSTAMLLTMTLPFSTSRELADILPPVSNVVVPSPMPK